MGRVDRERAKRKKETKDRLEITRREDTGQIRDTIPTYVFTRFIGGEHDDEEIVGRDLKRSRVTFGAEEGQTYVRKYRVITGFRLVAYVAEDLPKARYWPYMAMAAIAKSHHQMMQIKATEAKVQ